MCLGAQSLLDGTRGEAFIPFLHNYESQDIYGSGGICTDEEDVTCGVSGFVSELTLELLNLATLHCTVHSGRGLLQFQISSIHRSAAASSEK